MGGLNKAVAAAACGGVGAGLYLTVLIGSPGSLILVYLTQLPLFFAGLWLGVGGAIVAGGIATIVLLAVSGALAAALFAALNAVPVAVLVRQALLARRSGDDGAVEWYSSGRLTAWLTALALAGLAAALVALGGPDRMEAGLRAVIAEALSRIDGQTLAAHQSIATALALIMPGVIAASWMMMAVINAMLAQGLATRFGMNWRPTPDLAALGLPWWPTAMLAIAAAAVLWGGGARMLGVNVLIVLVVPFALAGLAVLHAAVRRLTHPVAALVAFYAVAGLFGWPLLVAAVVGLFEPWLGLRRRLAPPANF